MSATKKYCGSFILRNAAGAQVNADSTPTAAVYDSTGAVASAASVAVVAVSGKTGVYVWTATFTQPAWVAGVEFAVIGQAVVGGVTLNIPLKADLFEPAPAQLGDAMNLQGTYDAAKTAASQSSVNALGYPLQSTGYTAPDNTNIGVAAAQATAAAASAAASATAAALADLAALIAPAIRTISAGEDVVVVKTAGGATLATFTKTSPGGVETWTRS
jgi:hypothetical protein